MPDDPIVQSTNLCKQFKVLQRPAGMRAAVKALLFPRYAVKNALDGVNLSIRRGEILGYIGPNGAGKSTTIKILTGILLPSSGSVSVFGKDPFRFRKQNARRIGVVFGQRSQLWWNIPAIESLELMQRIYRVPDSNYKRNIEYFSDLLDLRSFIQTPVRQLSLGQRMRIDLCASLLHDPELLFLDEPTIGLDVVAKERIRDFIRDIVAQRKVTVVLTTHDLKDIERLCSRVVLLDKGKILYDGLLSSLKESFGSTESMTIATEDDLDAHVLEPLGIGIHPIGDRQFSVQYDRARVKPSRIIDAISEHTRILDFTIRTTEIDEMIGRIYKHGLLTIPEKG